MHDLGLCGLCQIGMKKTSQVNIDGDEKKHPINRLKAKGLAVPAV